MLAVGSGVSPEIGAFTTGADHPVALNEGVSKPNGYASAFRSSTGSV